MKVKVPWFVETYRQYDPEYYGIVKEAVDGAMTRGPLDLKTSLLVALGIFVYKGSDEEVKLVSKQARVAGATPEEIAQVIRISHLVSGTDVVRMALHAFED